MKAGVNAEILLWIERTGISIGELAQRCSISLVRTRNIVGGQAVPTDDEVRAIASALSMPQKNAAALARRAKAERAKAPPASGHELYTQFNADMRTLAGLFAAAWKEDQARTLNALRVLRDAANMLSGDTKVRHLAPRNADDIWRIVSSLCSKAYSKAPDQTWELVRSRTRAIKRIAS